MNMFRKRKDRADVQSKSMLRRLAWLVFGSVYVALQCYLFRVYHDTAMSQFGGIFGKQKLIGIPNHSGGDGNGDGSGSDRKNRQRSPDGNFNGYPIYKLDADQHSNSNFISNQQQHQTDIEELYSQFQCVGETWMMPELHRRSKIHHDQSWMHRSCRFQFFCYDTSTEEFVIYLDPEKHESSRKDHHYHDTDNVPQRNQKPHPSPHIEKILEDQRNQLLFERADDKRNETTTFKHPTFFDDTATVYRNHTVVVNGNGNVVLGDTLRGKQYGVSIGSINAKWGLVDIQRLMWWPEVRWGPIPGSSGGKDKDGKHEDSEYDVYTLPSSVVMLPFHSLSAENPGHLMWDDWLPIHTILGMFGFLKAGDSSFEDFDQNEVDLLPIRYHVDANDGRGLWASCDWLDSKKASCKKMLNKFGTLMGMRRSYLKYNPDGSENESEDKKENEDEDTNDAAKTEPLPPKRKKSAAKLPRIAVTTNRAVILSLAGEESESEPESKSESNSKPKLICSKNALVGIGGISDHRPFFGHGWESGDYFNSHNRGRGGQFFEFRNYMVHNLFSELPKPEIQPTMRPKKQEQQEGSQRLTSRAAYKTKGSVTLGKAQVASFPPSSVTDFGPDEPLVVLFSRFSSARRGGPMTAEFKDLQKRIDDAGGAYAALYGRDAAAAAARGNATTAIGANVEIVTEIHQFAEYTLEDQLHMATRTAVYVTFCGGGAVTASFLPRGGAVQIYFNEAGGIERNRKTMLPARLDWDFFNNLGYLHVGWIPIRRNETVRARNADWILGNLRRIHRMRVNHYNSQHQ